MTNINLNKYSFTGDEPKKLIQDSIHENGFIIVKNCFTKKQIKDFKYLFENPENKKKFINRPPARYIPGASQIVDGFENIVTDPRLLKVLKKIIEGKLVYTSHSDMHSGLSTGWHKDDGGGKYFGGQSDFYTNEDCCVYRVAIYLKDCTNQGGLSVKMGSHNSPDRNVGDKLYLQTELGDAVIFDCRITHKGWVKERNLISEFFLKALKKFSSMINVNIKRDKIPFKKQSIFLAYGPFNNFTEIYSRKNMEMQNEYFDEDISSTPIKLRNNLIKNDVHYYFK